MSDNLIFLISNEAWGKQWFSKHYYANELSKRTKVIFINPAKKWHIRNLVNRKIKKTKINQNLIVIDYCNPFPLVFQCAAIMLLNDWLNGLIIKSLVDCSQRIIIWQFDPFRFIHIFLKKYKRIYHVVDPYQTVKWDRIIASKADLVVTVRRDFISYYRKLNENTIFIPHGIAASQRTHNPEVTPKISSKYKPFILYIGTISRHINTGLLLKIANRFPTSNLLMIGPFAADFTQMQREDFDRLQKAKNFFHLWMEDSKHINNYVWASDVCIIPYYNDDKIKRAPLKLMNYISQLKPVVSSYKTDIEELENHIIYYSDNEDGFIRNLANCLQNKVQVNRRKVIAYLDEHAYQNLINKIWHHL